LPHCDRNIHEYGTLLNVISNRIIHEDANVIADVSVPEVIKVVSKLKVNKHDVVFELSSNSFKQGPVALFNNICMLFASFISFGHVLNKIIMCSMLPLIKDTRSHICSSENYHAIHLSTVLIKIYFFIIIMKGYQETTCNSVLKGNIQLYNVLSWSKKSLITIKL